MQARNTSLLRPRNAKRCLAVRKIVPVLERRRVRNDSQRKGKRCGKGYIAVGRQCLQKTATGKILYHGKEFDGFNQPKVSDRKGKKRMVLAKKGDRVKLVHYGASGYKHNYSEEAKKNYLRRSAGIRDKKGNLTKNNIFSPNYWARKDLWSRQRPADGSTRFVL